MKAILAIFIVAWCCSAQHDPMLSHPLSREFSKEISRCSEDPTYCENNYINITLLCAKVANDHAFLLLHDWMQSILMESFFVVSPESRLGRKFSHIRAMLSFAQGDVAEVS
jgi:hypothetical protein